MRPRVSLRVTLKVQAAPVMATAWGKQLQLDDPDDPALDAFIRAYEQGPQTPEPGAVCSRGIAEPE